MNRGMNVFSQDLLRRRREFWPAISRFRAAARIFMRIRITSYAPEARARIGEGARACDKSDWGFDLPERIFETRPDGG